MISLKKNKIVNKLLLAGDNQHNQNLLTVLVERLLNIAKGFKNSKKQVI